MVGEQDITRLSWGQIHIRNLIVMMVTLGLSVGEAPRFEDNPSPRDQWPTSVESGSNLRLQCLIKSPDDQNFTMSWQKDEIPVVANRHIQLRSRDQVLEIKLAEVTDSGIYSCQGHNTDGNTKRYEQHVKVEDAGWNSPPIIESIPANGIAYVEIGAEANISCIITLGNSCLFATMGWYRAGAMVNDTSDHQYIAQQACDAVSRSRTLTLSFTNISIKDLGTYTCVGKNNLDKLASKNITLFRKNSTNSPGEDDSPVALIVVLPVVGTAVLVTIILLVVVYRWKIKQYGHLNWEKPDLENFEIPDYELEYDVFISYSSEDEHWVKYILFRRLQSAGYNVCVDFKDFTPGMAIAENIMDAIYKSKRTVIVMSDFFLHSMWGQFELQQAHNRAIAQRKDVIILIKIDECKVPVKLLGKTFLDWKDQTVRPHFWQRLNDAIGQPGDLKSHQPIKCQNGKKPMEKHVDGDQNEDLIVERDKDQNDKYEGPEGVDDGTGELPIINIHGRDKPKRKASLALIQAQRLGCAQQ